MLDTLTNGAGVCMGGTRLRDLYLSFCNILNIIPLYGSIYHSRYCGHRNIVIYTSYLICQTQLINILYKLNAIDEIVILMRRCTNNRVRRQQVPQLMNCNKLCICNSLSYCNQISMPKLSGIKCLLHAGKGIQFRVMRDTSSCCNPHLICMLVVLDISVQKSVKKSGQIQLYLKHPNAGRRIA